LQQVAVAVRGSCTMILDDGEQRTEVTMNDPTVGIEIPPYVWHEMKDFSEDCVLLVFADQVYDESDYIRNYETFLATCRA
jgi:dTDP-4-dehydrorhamnose 3,5-epimerase-like enzyme